MIVDDGGMQTMINTWNFGDCGRLLGGVALIVLLRTIWLFIPRLVNNPRDTTTSGEAPTKERRQKKGLDPGRPVQTPT